VFDDEPGSYDICPVCFWEDDIVQLRWPNFSGGANRPSLIDAQKNVSRLGAVEERLAPYVRPPTAAEPVHPLWRPFDVKRDVIEEHRPGFDYKSYAGDGTTYYYWLDTGR
jgi:hypothetical protein